MLEIIIDESMFCNYTTTRGNRVYHWGPANQPTYSAQSSQWYQYFQSKPGLFEGIGYDPNPCADMSHASEIDKLKKINVFSSVGIG